MPSRSPARSSSSSATAASASTRRCTSTRRGSSGSRQDQREAPRGRPPADASAARAGRRARPRRRDRRPRRGPRRRVPAGTRRARAGRHARRASRGSWRARPFLAAQRGERIGIVGPNGAGKTTLLRTIAGDLPPLDGIVAFGHSVQLGYLAQLRDAGDPRRDGPRRAARGDPGHARRGARLPRAVPVPRRRRRSRRCGRCPAASGRGSSSRCSGSCRRTCSSSTSRRTTSTSRRARRSRRSCAESPATLLVVSHDRRLLETICEQLWVVDDGAAVAVRRRLPRLARGGRGRLDRGEGEAEQARDGSGRARGPAATAQLERRGRDQRCRRTTTPAAPAARPSERSRRRHRSPPGRSDGSRSCRRTPTGARRRRSTRELTRLGLRKSQLELAMGIPSVTANFVEMRRVTSELADVDRRSPTPRTPGSSSRSAPRDESTRSRHRPHRARSAAASRRSPAGCGAAGRASSSTPTRSHAT